MIEIKAILGCDAVFDTGLNCVASTEVDLHLELGKFDRFSIPSSSVRISHLPGRWKKSAIQQDGHDVYLCPDHSNEEL